MSAIVFMLLSVSLLGQPGEDAASQSEQPAIAFTFDPLIDLSESGWMDLPPPFDPNLDGGEFGTRGTVHLNPVSRRLRWDGQLIGPVNIELLAAERDLYEFSGVRVGRAMFLADGGFSDDTNTFGDESLYSILRDTGEFDLYDISLEMYTLGNDELALKMISGFRAIRAHVGQTTTSTDSGGNTISTYNKRRGMVAVPVVGAGVEWNPAPRFSLEGSAVSHAIDNQGTYLDLTAEAKIQFTHNIDFITGYQFVRSVMEVRDIEAELADNGLFARLQIRF
ncbi:MAG: hypothetical protein KF757_01230 [Phycisphaeraceae bacterium]|nr:hypothetical protein [Phycisphaeraceae bacterium]MCW5761831.1 hypothetical protein [Phycisphaeraceae bacterium]